MFICSLYVGKISNESCVAVFSKLSIKLCIIICVRLSQRYTFCSMQIIQEFSVLWTLLLHVLLLSVCASLTSQVLALECQCKGSISLSPVVDDERMRMGNWLRLLLNVLFSASTLMVWWQERYLLCKKCYTNPQGKTKTNVETYQKSFSSNSEFMILERYCSSPLIFAVQITSVNCSLNLLYVVLTRNDLHRFVCSGMS